MTVIDSGRPRNAPSHAVHGLFGLEGTSPRELLARGRQEVTGLGGEIIDGEVEDVTATGESFEVRLADGRTLRARRILIATGLIDELPDLPGVAELWGRDVLHCPYRHGREARDRGWSASWAPHRCPCTRR